MNSRSGVIDGIRKDDLNILRGTRHGRIRTSDLKQMLNIGPEEQVLRSGIEGGTRRGKPVHGEEVEVRPGDTFTAGPIIEKATLNALPREIRAEFEALRRAGFGGVQPPSPSEEGWRLRIKDLTLAKGVRTDALIVLPHTYPLASPVGFYVKKGANLGNLDRYHLFNRGFYDAPTLNYEKEQWQWFCGVLKGWKPMQHNLVSYITIVLALFNGDL